LEIIKKCGGADFTDLVFPHADGTQGGIILA
jgi:hypothetical protein